MTANRGTFQPVDQPRPLREALRLAWADYWREGLMSACAILGLAAVLAPLLVLFGVRQGVVSHLEAKLLDDPRNLEIVPLGSGAYDRDWLRALARKPEVGFVMAQTRAIAATMDLRPTEDGGPVVTATLIPTAAGDPVLWRWRPGLKLPADQLEASEYGVVLSEPAARKLGLTEGRSVWGEVGRRRDQRLESGRVRLTVLAVLPLEAQQREALYGPLALLLAAEDFRDGRAVPALGWTGEEPPPEAGRRFASFRLYARALDDVAALRTFFQARGLEVHTQAEAIEGAQSLSRSLALVLALITGTAGLGFLAAAAGGALAGVRRKSRSLGLMRLMGHSGWGLRLFPLAQTWLTGIFGFGLAWLFYLGTVWGLERIFSDNLPAGQPLSVIFWPQALAALGLTLALSSLAALAASWRAAAVEPAEVIRDL